MVKWKYIWIGLAIISAGVCVYLFFRKKNISFEFGVGQNLTGLLNLMKGRYAASRGVGVYINVPLTTTVENKNSAKVIMQNLAGSLSYEGEAILQTQSGSPALANVEIEGKQARTITDNVQLLVNQASLKMISELIKGNKPQIKYDFTAFVLGKPQSFSNTSTINNTSTT